MEELYGWIRNIIFYLIFMAVAVNLLPDKKYEKYLKLFAGMVLILLVVKPFTGGMKLEEKLAYYFESISFQNETGELYGALSGMETERLNKMIAQYEEAVGEDIKAMARTAGFGCKKVKAGIEGDMEKPDFGKVEAVRLTVYPEVYESLAQEGTGSAKKNVVQEKTAAGDQNRVAVEIDPVSRVKKVDVAGTEGGGKDQGTWEELRRNRRRQEEENTKVVSLRRRIAEYYDLEEQDIEIQLEDE